MDYILNRDTYFIAVVNDKFFNYSKRFAVV